MGIFWISLKGLLRDRALHGLALAALLLFLLVPVFSLFSMRQVQELAVSLALSSISFVLLVLAILYGASSLWRDIERRFAAAVLGLPISRCRYVLGKFFAIATFLMLCAALLGAIALCVVPLAASQYPSQMMIAWGNILVAVAFSAMKYVLLAAFAMLFSAISTSFFLPVFGGLAIFFAGSASQEVMKYLSGEFGEKISPVAKGVIQGLYYLLPNFSAFDFHVHAIYNLPIPGADLLFTFAYFLVYTAIVLTLAIWIFGRRELT